MARRGVLPAGILWSIVLLSFAAGLVLLSSVGSVLILLAALLAMLAPLRPDPRAFWPLAVGVLVFLGGYTVTAPVNCREGAVAFVDGGQVPSRFCDSVVGIDYERIGDEDPSPLPAFAASLGGGILVAALLRLVWPRRRPVEPVEPIEDLEDPEP
ncbi:MAG: hypothetical protein WD770_08540 [Actinomycetota bacterium]